MKFISIPSLVLLASAVLPCLAQTAKITYNTLYDGSNYPLADTACSNGANGLETKWPVLGDVPNFPNVGGIPGLVWNSTLCGTCWQIDYTAPDGSIHGIAITAVDEAYTFDIAETAFSDLAGSTGVAAGFVSATVFQVSPSACGIN